MPVRQPPDARGATGDGDEGVARLCVNRLLRTRSRTASLCLAHRSERQGRQQSGAYGGSAHQWVLSRDAQSVDARTATAARLAQPKSRSGS